MNGYQFFIIKKTVRERDTQGAERVEKVSHELFLPFNTHILNLWEAS
jgi:hypothetical protein